MTILEITLTAVLTFAVVGLCIALAERFNIMLLRRAEVRARIRELRHRPRESSQPAQYAASAAQEAPAVRPQYGLPAVPLDPPPELVRAIAGGDCVLFVGAGLVAQAGFPTYYELVSQVLAEAAHRHPNGPWPEADKRLRAGDLDSVVDLARSRLGPDVVASLMQQAIQRTEPGRARTLDMLQSLPLAGIVTSDWSGYVFRTFSNPAMVRLSPWNAERGVDALRSSQPFLLEVSGHASRDEFLVTADDLRQMTLAEPQYARFITTLATTRSLLFMGASPRGIEQFMGSIRRSDRQRHHWALVPREAATAVDAERLFARFGVELIVYEPGESHERATTEFAERLRGLVASRSLPAPPAEVERLRELRLRNIGPFESLDLSLDQRTILLGDNGSGKSTVLKAIALALLGDLAPRELAGHMLNTRAARGEVVLKTAKDTYSTSLVREHGEVSVNAHGFAPIQARPWFAIGFPPMRGTSTTAPTGPSGSGGEGPTSRDLIPILENKPDTRLNDLKQWVVNMQVRADDELEAGHILERFFKIVEDLTPGVDFSYEGVDRRTWEVRLTTPDGPIPFDLLSRGMTAMLGWIGVLLQRMYEIYDSKDGPPEQQRALVLVDEIDVHLHPEWQQQLLPLLDRHFPKVQLIATTHSPLIVGSAGAGEVQVLQRIDGVLNARELPTRFEGWRSDQILTSEAFGMTSTRDATTAARHVEYRDLLARGETPEVNKRAAELHDQLSAVVPSPDETPDARAATKLFREWLESNLRDAPEAERARVQGEAELYLRRLYSGEEE